MAGGDVGVAEDLQCTLFSAHSIRRCLNRLRGTLSEAGPSRSAKLKNAYLDPSTRIFQRLIPRWCVVIPPSVQLHADRPFDIACVSTIYR